MQGPSASEEEPMADMNMVPLIDIALTLVIILMVTTVFQRSPGVGLRLPTSSTREGTPETRKDVVVTVMTDGSTKLDGQTSDLAQLQNQLKTVASKDKDARILIKGDRTVPYSRIMEVMDTVRQAGLSRVVLPTDPRPVTSSK